MKVLFLINVPSPYRVKFFNELGKYCELTVLFEKTTSTERDDSWKQYSFENFNGIILNGFSFSADTSLCLSVKKYLEKGMFDIIVCCNFTSPTGMYAIRYMKRHHIPYILESDGGFAKTGSGLKEKLKYNSICGAEYYLSTSKVHDEYYQQYGAKKEQLVRYPFSSVSENEILTTHINKEEKELLKRELGIREEKVILSVGQFIYRKGYDILLESVQSLPKNIGVYIVGGEPTNEYLDIKTRLKLKNVHFIGFKKPSELFDFYRVSDLFVLPTREDIWGLVINEAFAFGLPVITTDRCLAGLEMIKDGENGYIVPVENSSELSKAMSKALFDNDRQESISFANLRKAHQYTIETMVKSHIELFARIKRVC